jgi:hypothetical protein
VSDDGGSNGFQPGPKLYRSTNGGAAFTLLNTFGANVTAIQVDPNNSNNVWIGLDSGVIQSITNALAVTPSFNLLGNPDPATRPTPAPVSSIAVDPSDLSGQTVVVTYEGFSATAAGLRTQHAYRTTDGGQNWTDISGTDGQANTNLPDLPTHSVVIDPATVPPSIIVSDDAGVLRSLDTGATWQALGTGLPNVDSTSLAIDTTVNPSVLRVGTYGRSVFTLASATGPVLDVKGDLAFGEVQTGKSDTRTVQLYDVGTTDLHISSFSLTSGSAAFSIISGPTSFPVTVTPGAHKDWTVKYAPTAAANDTAQFTAPSDDPSTPAQIPASGSAVASTGGGDNNTDDCAKRYVAQGDGVVVGTDIGNDSGNQHDRYSDKLLKDDLQPITGLTTGTVWCLYNTATDPATTDSFIQGSNSQQSQAWNLKPDLITLQLGRQNNSIVDQVDKCFKNVKDHDFAEANTCALAVFGNTTAWQKLTKDLGGILNAYKTQMAGNPTMVVAVLGYYNPYPTATSVATKIPAFCNQLVDTIPTCIARWILLPPALVTLDQVVKKLNSTISAVVQNFIVASQGRFFFINPYDKFKDHCMTMKVTIKTTVYHPTNDPDHHDTDETDFGCKKNWVVSDGNDGTKSPFPYLTPATDGVLLLATQTTKEMGINPNKKGHMCLEQLIWETVKNKLGVPQKADLANACSTL